MHGFNLRLAGLTSFLKKNTLFGEYIPNPNRSVLQRFAGRQFDEDVQMWRTVFSVIQRSDPNSLRFRWKGPVVRVWKKFGVHFKLQSLLLQFTFEIVVVLEWVKNGVPKKHLEKRGLFGARPRVSPIPLAFLDWKINRLRITAVFVLRPLVFLPFLKPPCTSYSQMFHMLTSQRNRFR